MSRKDNCARKFDSILGANIKVDAVKLSGQESIRIDGDYVGDIDTGILMISQTGRVSGNIQAKQVKIAGSIIGSIQCASLLHLTSTAQVEADIETQYLITEEGARFNGMCLMTVKPEERKLQIIEPSESFDNKFNRFVGVVSNGTH